MILFCEDCGEKNELDSTAFSDGKAIFRCCVCAYPNAYAFSFPERSPRNKPGKPDKLASLFDLIQSSSGIIGAFLYHENQGLIRKKMPPFLTDKDLNTLGSALAKSYSEACVTCSDMMKMTVMISDKYFSVFKMSAGLFVVVIATGPDLSDKVRQLIAELQKEGL